MHKSATEHFELFNGTLQLQKSHGQIYFTDIPEVNELGRRCCHVDLETVNPRLHAKRTACCIAERRSIFRRSLAQHLHL